MRHDLRDPAVFATDHGERGRHRLKHHDRHALDVAIRSGHAWSQKEIGGPHHFGDLTV